MNYRKWTLKYIFIFLTTFVVFYTTERWTNLFEINSNLKILQLSLILTSGDILYNLLTWFFNGSGRKNINKS